MTRAPASASRQLPSAPPPPAPARPRAGPTGEGAWGRDFLREWERDVAGMARARNGSRRPRSRDRGRRAALSAGSRTAGIALRKFFGWSRVFRSRSPASLSLRSPGTRPSCAGGTCYASPEPDADRACVVPRLGRNYMRDHCRILLATLGAGASARRRTAGAARRYRRAGPGCCRSRRGLPPPAAAPPAPPTGLTDARESVCLMIEVGGARA